MRLLRSRPQSHMNSRSHCSPARKGDKFFIPCHLVYWVGLSSQGQVKKGFSLTQLPNSRRRLKVFWALGQAVFIRWWTPGQTRFFNRLVHCWPPRNVCFVQLDLDTVHSHHRPLGTSACSSSDCQTSTQNANVAFNTALDEEISLLTTKTGRRY